MNGKTSPLGRHAAVLLAAGLLAAGTAQAAHPLVGVWLSDVQRIDCTSGAVVGGFQGMQVYHAGGTMTDTNSGPPASRGPGMGVWAVRGGVYETRFRFMRYDPTGAFVGWAVVTRTITPDASGTTATGAGSAEALDPAGNVVGSSCTRDVSVKVD